MTRSKLYLLTTFCLLATVPWFFTEPSSTHILGFPLWAFYSLCLTLLYAILIAFLLHRYWNLLAGEEHE